MQIFTRRVEGAATILIPTLSLLRAFVPPAQRVVYWIRQAIGLTWNGGTTTVGGGGSEPLIGSVSGHSVQALDQNVH